MATLARTIPKEFIPPEGEDFMQGMAREEAALAALMAVSDALPDGDVVGGILSFPMGDGMAFYRVAKAKPLTLEHIPAGDQWSLPTAHLKGIRMADVVEQLRRRKAFKTIWAQAATRQAAI
jgi:hypothetical protein